MTTTQSVNNFFFEEKHKGKFIDLDRNKNILLASNVEFFYITVKIRNLS